MINKRNSPIGLITNMKRILLFTKQMPEAMPDGIKIISCFS